MVCPQFRSWWRKRSPPSSWLAAARATVPGTQGAPGLLQRTQQQTALCLMTGTEVGPGGSAHRSLPPANVPPGDRTAVPGCRWVPGGSAGHGARWAVSRATSCRLHASSGPAARAPLPRPTLPSSLPLIRALRGLAQHLSTSSGPGDANLKRGAEGALQACSRVHRS